VLVFSLLVGFNIAVWAAVLISSAKYGILLGLAPIAYGFGLRHAVDPDHIAAIDNTTRKLMQDKQKPVGVGFFFSLGHSTVVFFLSVLIALSAAFIKKALPDLQSAGAVVGTSVSGSFLILIAVLNIMVLTDVFRTWQIVSRGGGHDGKGLDGYIPAGGLMSRLLRPLTRMVERSWHMYPIGLLFGLGFDTASEVGIPGMSATAGAGGMPVWFILLLPLLFVAGMSLVDTADGVAMLGAYGWAPRQAYSKALLQHEHHSDLGTYCLIHREHRSRAGDQHRDRRFWAIVRVRQQRTVQCARIVHRRHLRRQLVDLICVLQAQAH
jgi:high-affinity nickel-transport protein